MKVVNAGYVTIGDCGSVTKKIERIARVCYKSEGAIGEDTDVKMLNKLVERKHYAMLEHASLAYVVPSEAYINIFDVYDEILHDRTFFERADEIPSMVRLRFTCTDIGDTYRYVISANIRAWLEFFEHCVKLDAWSEYFKPIVEDIYSQTNGVVNFIDCVQKYSDHNIEGMHIEINRVTDFNLLTASERMIHEDFSILFTVDRGVTHEMVRMRDASFAQESTRYCNYSAGKFGNEITVIKPVFWDEDSECYKVWKDACEYAEKAYNKLTELNAPAQQARSVLPTEVKANIVITTNLAEWRHIFELRACDLTGPAHPQMKEVMCPLCHEMQKKYDFAFGDLDIAWLEG